MVADSTAELKSAAGGNVKAAGTAVDRAVGAAIAKGNALKETLAVGSPDGSAQVEAVMAKFVARANDVRGQLNSQQLSAGKALDEVGSDATKGTAPELTCYTARLSLRMSFSLPQSLVR